MVLVDGGQQKRTFTAIEDVCELMVLILDNAINCKGQAFNVGHPENEISMKDLAEKFSKNWPECISNEMDSKAGSISISGTEFYGSGYQDSPRRLPNIDSITKATGWKPKRKLATVLPEILKWYYKHYSVQKTQ